jgi:hypothetical protein
LKEKNERFLSFCDKQIDFWNFEEELDNGSKIFFSPVHYKAQMTTNYSDKGSTFHGF